jgi:hypothetical protein
MTFLIDLVSDLIEDRPGSNVDELLPELPGYTRHQVKQALQNASFRGTLRCEKQGVRGRHKGAKPGRYYVVDQPAVQPVRQIPKCANSVFALGDYA